MKNRRNYYRILQVQHDAPVEIIRTSYRALMRELRKHPDMGGDHWTASIINEAYETLCDSEKRAEYDRELFEHYTKDIFSSRISDKKSVTSLSCPFCNTSLTRQTEFDDSCPCCMGSGLERHKKSHPGNYHRSVIRMKMNGTLVYYLSKPQKGRDAKMLDLSPRGVRFICTEELEHESTLRIQCQLFKARARIVNSEQSVLNGKKVYSVGASFLSVSFKKPCGSFHSSIA